MELLRDGFYGRSVKYGSLQERAIVIHQIQDKKDRAVKNLLHSTLSRGYSKEAMEQYLSVAYPFYDSNRESKEEREIKQLRALRSIDWSEVFDLDEQHAEDARERRKAQEDNILKHYKT